MSNNCYVFNFWHSQNNYGAKLTGYALQKVLNLIGYDNYLVDLGVKNVVGKPTCFRQFENKHLKSVHNGLNYKKLNSLDDHFAYIVGSDQVWRYGSKNNPFLLDFCRFNSKKISMSASFGVNKIKFLQENSSNVIEDMRKALLQFDYISVREKSGVEICRDIFGINAELIIDPVFILDKSNYLELINDADKEFANKIVSYVLDTGEEYDKAYKYLEKKYNTKVIKTSNSNMSIENWLKSIKDCDLFITDSFHGMCFAIIFNKPFICITNEKRGSTRFESILEILNIEYQCLKSIQEIYEKDCVFKVDYNIVNKKILIEAKKGIEFLQKALTSPIKINEEKMINKINYLESRIYQLENINLRSSIKENIWLIWKNIFYRLPMFIQNYIRNKRGR